MKVRRIIGLLAAMLVAVAVAACGGVSTDPTSSPANTVPSSAVFYASATVQPSNGELQTLQQVVNRVGGPGTASRLLGRLQRALTRTHHGVSFAKDVAPWIGQQVAVAITKWPASLGAGAGSQHGSAIEPYVVLIFPTAHPNAARKALPTLEHSGGSMPKNMTAEVSGNYVLVGGRQAVAAVAATAQGSSLASDSNYQADLAKLEPHTLANLYVNVHSLQALARSSLQRTQAPGAGALLQSLPQTSANATAMLGLSATSNSLRLDVVSSGTTGSAPASPASVAGLPADSWLAVSTQSVSAARLKSLSGLFGAMSMLGTRSSMGSLHAGASSTAKASFQGSSASQSGTFVSLKRSSKAKHHASKPRTHSNSRPAVNPAQSLAQLQAVMPLLFKSGLGPIDVSLAGSSVSSLRAGLSLSEKDATSASQLTQLIYTFAQLGKAKVSGTPSSFSIAVNKRLHVQVGTSGSAAVATIGYPNQSAFTSPSSTLADNSVYKQAVSQLPSSNNVSLFANFDGISQVVASDPHAAKKPGLNAALKRFSYLIAGGTQGDMRIVLGLH